MYEYSMETNPWTLIIKVKLQVRMRAGRNMGWTRKCLESEAEWIGYFGEDAVN